MTDSEIIAEVLRGDARAERQFYDANVDRIYRLAWRMAGDETLARDFTQDTFIRAFERLADFRGDSSLATWLHSIAVSVILIYDSAQNDLELRQQAIFWLGQSRDPRAAKLLADIINKPM